MKKIVYVIVFAAALLAGTTRAEAIEPQYDKGTMIGAVNLGIYGAGLGANATFDYVLVDSWWKGHFTVGGEIVDYSSSGSNFSIMPRVTYGLNITDALEVHLGIAEGIGFRNNSMASLSSSQFVGVHYFFNDQFGLSAETGYVNFLSYIRCGIALRF